MARYRRKKSRIIEAVQWNGDTLLLNAPKWLIDAQDKGDIRFISDDIAIITGLQNDVVLNIGDYIVKGVDDIFILKAEVFERQFELIDEDKRA